MKALTLMIVLLAVIVVLGGNVKGVHGDLDAHSYSVGEEVILWVNKVGPFRNPQETYFYYSLPFCQPREFIQSDHNSLGESLQSYDLTMSPLEILFRTESPGEKVLCSKKFTEKEAQQMRYDKLLSSFF